MPDEVGSPSVGRSLRTLGIRTVSDVRRSTSFCSGSTKSAFTIIFRGNILGAKIGLFQPTFFCQRTSMFYRQHAQSILSNHTTQRLPYICLKVRHWQRFIECGNADDTHENMGYRMGWEPESASVWTVHRAHVDIVCSCCRATGRTFCGPLCVPKRTGEIACSCCPTYVHYL